MIGQLAVDRTGTMPVASYSWGVLAHAKVTWTIADASGKTSGSWNVVENRE